MVQDGNGIGECEITQLHALQSRSSAFVTMIPGAECIGYVPKVSLMSTWISDDTSHMLILLPRSHQFVAPILVPGAPFLTKKLGNVQPKELVVG